MNRLIIGLTGQFGSGCTTLKDILCKKYKFKEYSFSKLIRIAAKKKRIYNPTRNDLQNIGNEYRKKDPAYWAKKICLKIISNTNSNRRYVVDGFRNVSEILHFKHLFKNRFYLIAVNAENRDIRWIRQKRTYDEHGLTSADFDIDDARDRGERFSHGQQVTRCIDYADIVIDNTNQCYFPKTAIDRLTNRIKRYIEMITRTKQWSLSPNELEMYLAYKIGSRSPCSQRHVGAVIFNKNRRNVISYGYNSPPFKLGCMHKFGGCHKEMRMYYLWENMWKWVDGKECPNCKTKLKDLSDHYFYCPKCHYDMKSLVMPTKGADHCVAIHAEDMAISIAKKYRLKNSILFTTTFPCLQCALKIMQAGIRYVYYVEPYPIPETDLIKNDLFKGRVKYKIFEGIKSTRIVEKLLK